MKPSVFLRSIGYGLTFIIPKVSTDLFTFATCLTGHHTVGEHVIRAAKAISLGGQRLTKCPVKEVDTI